MARNAEGHATFFGRQFHVLGNFMPQSRQIYRCSREYDTVTVGLRQEKHVGHQPIHALKLLDIDLAPVPRTAEID
ncbi:MAG: hypothetical protein EOP50_06505 [Sphingobacteriales bacterium]|nr:MAG: hypothetical protein EOP50_06505 [Sphingobacteriales bacterium]